MTSIEQDAKRSFLGYVKGKEMTVLHDEGLYRHLRFGARGSVGWFELVTWPGSLAIKGDIGGSYIFARLDDMFQFFGSNPDYINPGYWDEKIQAGGPTRAFSDDLFKQRVVEYFWDIRHAYKGESARLFRAIREDVLDYGECQDEARTALNTFAYRDNDGELFEFGDTWEWNFTDWSIHYLRACYAIVWGISRYRAVVSA
ncbi:hypothetical protein OG874_00070 [Nocardia sp. NBC_00565]|uniref:hypothetical protein n=1 Tax=Nocardia sp. NBC_00565 TaxID=2975993 RepID=UPI002E80B684|nr:hypothetical protein [Nocardia sp. NBC_00565]WUC03649.1 hypothetical protein OG874_00070 [Nocardia sp. NBC_00565]